MKREKRIFTLLLVLVSVPSLFLLPRAAHIVENSGWNAVGDSGWLFPAYVLLSAVCAFVCFPARKTIAWILVALVVLTDLFLLVTFLK